MLVAEFNSFTIRHANKWSLRNLEVGVGILDKWAKTLEEILGNRANNFLEVVEQVLKGDEWHFSFHVCVLGQVARGSALLSTI